MRFLPAVIAFGVITLVSPAPAHAKLWINEFYSDGSTDWIELYNDGSESIDLTHYKIRDNSNTNKLDLSGNIESKGFTTFDWGNKLNNGGDTIKLVEASNENNIHDQVAYGPSDADISSPNTTQSAGRLTDGQSTWAIFSNHSRGSSNTNSNQAPTPTPTAQPTPTPTKIPTPTKTPTPPKSSSSKTPTSGSSQTISGTSPSSTKSQQVTSARTTANLSGAPTAILGANSKISPQPSPNKKIIIQGASQNPLRYLALVVGLVSLACAILVFFKTRKKNAL
jgi:hypothetical protein